MRQPHETVPRKGLSAALIGIAVFSGVINILGFTGPLFMLEVYDRVIPSGSLPTLIALVMLAAGLYAFSGLLDIIRLRVFSRIAGIVDMSLSRRVLAAIAGASARPRTDTDALTPAREMDQVRGFIGGNGPAALFDLPWIPVYLAICFFLHPLIGWLASVTMLVLIGLTVATDILTRNRTRQAAAAVAARNRLGEAAGRNGEAIAAMGMLDAVEARWSEAHTRLTGLQARTGDIVAILSGASKTLRQVVQSGSLALGAYLVILGEMSGGMIIAASVIVTRALQPVEQVIGNWRGMLAARQAWQRLNTLIDKYPTASDRTALPAPEKSLTLEHVFVAPPGAPQKPIVQNVSLMLKAGTVLGIVGQSASGKSTLARALTGVWPPARGRIRLDGASLDQWSPRERGRHIGYMPQASDLFPGTIAENIGRLDPQADDAAIIAAATAAGAHEMIVRLEDGYETQVGDAGTNLSAGQRQRVALARALYRDPFLVVLDEPNASLDAEGDRALADALSAVKARGGIAVVIAHRNSVLDRLDLLLVMEGGIAKAFGPRDEVLKSLAQQGKRGPRPAARHNLAVVETEAQP